MGLIRVVRPVSQVGSVVMPFLHLWQRGIHPDLPERDVLGHGEVVAAVPDGSQVVVIAIGVDCFDEVSDGHAGVLVSRFPVQIVEAEPYACVESVQPDRYGDVCLCQVGGDLEVDFRIQLNQLVGVRQPEADVALDDDVDEPGPYPCGLWHLVSEIDL